MFRTPGTATEEASRLIAWPPGRQRSKRRVIRQSVRASRSETSVMCLNIRLPGSEGILLAYFVSLTKLFVVAYIRCVSTVRSALSQRMWFGWQLQGGEAAL